MSKDTFKPGNTVPVSGIYQNNKTKEQVTSVRGEHFPPTPGRGQDYSIVKPTKHKTGK